MRSTVKNSIVVVIALSFALGCSFLNQVKKQVEEAQKPKVIDATDGKSQITVPGNWETHTGLNSVASIQVANLFEEQYAIVITESKQDFTSKMTLESYRDIIWKNAKEKLDGAVLGESRSITVNGYPATQFEAEGTVSNIKAKWLYTLIDAPKNYHQILAWSIASKYDGNKAIFLDVINSFKETDGAGSSSPPPPPPKKR